MNVKVYVEGGGDRQELRARCREGFRSFFGKAGLTGRMPRIVSCGSRQNAYNRFRIALTGVKDEDFVLLLVDSEGPVAHGSDAWSHLRDRDNWDRPEGATVDSAHLMVQCTEAWFIADTGALQSYFGRGFRRNSLPQRPDVEHISKADLDNGLKEATRNSRKGVYHKGRHSFAVLAMLSPEQVIAASPHAQRLVDTLLAVAVS